MIWVLCITLILSGYLNVVLWLELLSQAYEHYRHQLWLNAALLHIDQILSHALGCEAEEVK